MNSTRLLPTDLKVVDNNVLQIVWNDGFEQRLGLTRLRNACPCATCREKERGAQSKPVGQLPVLSAAEAAPLRIESMQPVGQYAYNVKFSDGHGSGIFTFDLLRSLA
jgi:DUF971 family protein